MAGEWLKWSKGLTRKPEILKIAARLMMRPTEAAGVLMVLMEWLDDATNEPDYNENGDAVVTLGALPIHFIDGIVGTQGFAEAMAEVGWLKHTNEGKLLFVHADRHNGNTAKSRALTRDRMAGYRNKKALRSSDASTVTPSSLSLSLNSGSEGGAGGNRRPVQPALDMWLLESKRLHPDWPPSDATGAWEHYEKVGWKTSGGTKIQKWEMCIGTCYRNWAEKHGRNGSQLTLTADVINSRRA